MKGRAAARLVVFSVIHALLCIFAALYAVENAGLLGLVEMPDSPIYVDGSDFTGLISIMAVSANGLVSAVISVVYFAVMTVLSAALLLPFRFIAVRRFSVVTPMEKNVTLAVILAGTLLSALGAMIFGGITVVPYCLLFLLPALLVEVLMYWLVLYFRCKK